MRKSILLILAMLCIVFMVAACGSEETAGNDTNIQGTTSDDTENTNENEQQVASEDDNTEATEIHVIHRLGEATVTVNPERIIVFDFGALDTLDKMGIDVLGVPQANVPSNLAKFSASEYENIGTLFEPDFEKIHKLNPDLIIISARQSDLYDELANIAPTIYMGYMGIDEGPSFDVFKQNMELLGQIFDKEDVIEKELHAIDEKVEEINDENKAIEKSALVVLSKASDISVYGPGSRFGIIYDEFGFIPADTNIDISTHGMNVNFEYLLDKDPDYLFVIDQSAVTGGEETASQVMDNELIQRTNAYQNDKIIYLDPNHWYISVGGLRTVAEMIKEIEASIK